ncbi:sulfatase [Echinicola shivajiensis]|uniref:sulfatase n=1 Tax=Echinicola shivajiensis TaxID=1035916 RepID=UPI001BFC684F|nr:sulfatase [Echinicola shivajiensis]
MSFNFAKLNYFQLKSIALIALFGLILLSTVSCQEKEQAPPNILFIAIDDLRPELGAYGKDYVHSPNLDKLASQSSLFKNHYVTVPTCGASRYSLLTGQLPRTKGDLSNQVAADKIAGKPEGEVPETFVHQLNRNGYYTIGIGKISHHPDGYVYAYREPKSDKLELPHSWDEMLFDAGKWGTGHNAFFGYADGSNRNDLKMKVKPYEMAEVGDEGYPDGLTANLAIEKLRYLKKNKSEEPFCLAVGFFKPHLPFNAPKKYWDLYDEDSIPLAPFADIPENASKVSLHGSGEFNNYQLGEEKAGLDHKISDAYAKRLRHGYLAAISYVDAQVGKVLEELERLGMDENTIVVVWGDHGWHLGDQLVWGKHTIFERGLKSVLMIKNPKLEGAVIDKIVSSTDIYPTLMDLAGVETNYPLDGKSMVPLMENPNWEDWRNTAYGYFRNGISLRTPDYRLSKYYRDQQPEIELYDHRDDPNETVNIAQENPEIVEQLMPLWEQGNTGIYE